MRTKPFRFVLLALTALVAISTSAQYVVCTGDNVRLRLGPSTDAPMLINSKGSPVYVNKGQKLTYIGSDSRDFYNVRYNGQNLYISKQFSKLVNTTNDPKRYTVDKNTRYVVINGTNVRLRYGPSLTANIYRNEHGTPIFPPKGSMLIYAGQSGDWYKAYYDGRIFYISKKHSYLK